MRVLAIIPARGGSKRVPGKNKRLFAGKPLVSWVVEAALKARRLDRIVVSSDDDDILEIADKYPTILSIQRPTEISGDESLAIEYVRHALTSLKTYDGSVYDTVAILQPSSPLTRPIDIDSTIELLEESKADSSVSVMQLDHAIHPAKLKVLQKDRLYPYLEDENGRMAAHELPTIYVRNCAVYVTRKHVLDQGEIIGQDCRAYIMPREFSVDINDEYDFQFAEFLENKISS